MRRLGDAAVVENDPPWTILAVLLVRPLRGMPARRRRALIAQHTHHPGSIQLLGTTSA